ncbi:TlyA family RNA methyltransferase [Candidatus Contubernalis alkaliaceticus]|uniref:TlyA family RNA methyltransferase n=1 Tax=Candidatus Contubernalis alkaliaceticus TaxID=338645 RepID=UPI001F4BF970|nr:TlyA family RNA methyltransferase [Candidatus Contubernalis alkalaceticus]UNC92540.1 TlyA family RNA methyltransferase [Candidatus Contubernalis alkalaceticus]
MKERLDNLMVAKGYCSSRSRAKALIMMGKVFVDGKRVDKAGCPVDPSSRIEVQQDIPYVSRGGLKLEKALKEFQVSLTGKIVIDVGASTGGFTHCALKDGAEKVYAVDVGYGQLAWSLRNDPRVVNIERTNIRYLNPDTIQDIPEIATVDVAFISLKHIFPILRRTGTKKIIALIKPQFEAGKDKVGRKGVVKDPKVHREVIGTVLNQAKQQGYTLTALTFSPIKGPQGNIEYLALFEIENHPMDNPDLISLIETTVSRAVEEL